MTPIHRYQLAALLAGASILMLFAPRANAQSLSQQTYGKFTTPSGIEVFTGPNIPGFPSSAAARGQMIWNNTVNPSGGGVGGGMPEVGGSVTVPNPAGNPVKVDAIGKVTGPGVSQAAGKLLGELGKVANAIAVGVAVYDLATEIGHLISRDANNNIVYQKQDPSACTVLPCYQFAAPSSPTNVGGPWTYSGSEACSYLVGKQYYYKPVVAASFYLAGAGNGNCNLTYSGGAGSEVTVIPSRSAPVQQATMISEQMQDFLDAIASKSGWPASSSVYRMMKDATDALQKSGGTPYPVQPITVTGPPTSPGATVTTVNNTDNTTTTNTTTYNHNYAGNTVNTTSTTTNQTINNTTGAITNSTVTNNSTPSATPPDEGTATDTPLAELPKLYKPTYPDGLTGVWTKRKAELSASPLLSLTSRLMPTIGTGGTCPSWMLHLNVGIRDFGTSDVAPPCYIWDLAKFFILIGAALLCRALIFGG